MKLLISGVLIGILLGGLYALMASGLTLVWGTMRVLNIAQAAFVILGAYLSYSALTVLHVDPFLSMLFLGPIMFGLGVGSYYVFLRPIKHNRESLAVLVTYAMAAGIEGLLGLLYSTNYRAIMPSYAMSTFLVADSRLPVVQVYAFLASIAILGALGLVLKATRFGRALRAATQNPMSSQLLGVRHTLISAVGFGIGVGTAAVAGALYGMSNSFNPASQLDLIGILLAIVVLGGLGSMWGTLIGALILGIIASVAGVYVPLWSNFAFYCALFLVLLLRPQGLWGVRGGLSR